MFAKNIIMVAILLGTSVLISQPVLAQEFGRPIGEWKTDFSNSTIDMNEIIDVIGPDQIPSIDDPTFLPIGEVSDIPGIEPVVAFSHNGVSRAYPLRLLMWHEIVNDTIGGLDVAVTYCPLCNTSLVFERTLDGEAVTFGTTGKLRHSDLIMYDRKEQNWWQQFNGEAIVGIRAGEKLTALPSFLISYDLFVERYPDGEVLQPDPRRSRALGTNPYVNYDNLGSRPFLFRGDLPTDIEAMMRVAFVDTSAGIDEAIAVTLPYLQQNAPVVIGDLEFRWSEGQASALDQRNISASQDVGNIEVYRVNGENAEPIVYTVTFAFAARAFLPDLKIVQLEN